MVVDRPDLNQGLPALKLDAIPHGNRAELRRPLGIAIVGGQLRPPN